MHYIIDGYNLLFRTKTDDASLAKKRQYIIEELNKKIQLLKIRVSIVFDSNYRIDESPKSHYNHLEIQFTSRGITADDWIIERVRRSKHPEKKTVVTSDKKLASLIRQCGGKTEPIEEFIASLNKRYQNKLAPPPKNSDDTSKITLKNPLKPLPPRTEKKTASHLIQPLDLKPEQYFEHYLKIFEENFNKIAKPKTTPEKKTRPKKHEFPKEEKKETPYASDLERWQHLFEQNLQVPDKKL